MENDNRNLEYGAKDDVDRMFFSHFEPPTLELIRKRLTQFAYFSLFLDNKLPASKDVHAWSKAGNTKLDANFFNQSFYNNHFRSINSFFTEWLSEMAENTRAFDPFNMDIGNKIFSLVNDDPKKNGFFSFKRNYNYFIAELDKAAAGDNSQNAEQKFINTFFKATDSLVTKKFNYK